MTRTTRRIEPTFDGKETADHIEQSRVPKAHDSSRHVSIPTTIKLLVINKLNSSYAVINNVVQGQKKTLIFSITGLLLLLFTAILLSFSTTESDNEVTSLVITQPTFFHILQKNHQATFTDGFSLFTSEFSGLTIHWQGENTQQLQLWHMQKAQGEQSCQAIIFNNGDTFRTIEVNIENQSKYYANFSPLDSEDILSSIAKRGSFLLCGYKFSLKGSQAVLGKHPYYSELINN
jgi:hypothetical protein